LLTKERRERIRWRGNFCSRWIKFSFKGQNVKLKNLKQGLRGRTHTFIANKFVL